MNISLTVNANGVRGLLFIQSAFIDGIEDKSQNKAGWLRIEATTDAAAATTLAKAKTISWSYVGDADASGYTDVMRG